jgi:hypothetical protein
LLSSWHTVFPAKCTGVQISDPLSYDKDKVDDEVEASDIDYRAGSFRKSRQAMKRKAVLSWNNAAVHSDFVDEKRILATTTGWTDDR